MKALFLDIDGVLQPCGRQERFAHIDEIPSLCKQLNETVKTDFDYEAYVGNSYSNACDIGAVLFRLGQTFSRTFTSDTGYDRDTCHSFIQLA